MASASPEGLGLGLYIADDVVLGGGSVRKLRRRRFIPRCDVLDDIRSSLAEIAATRSTP